MARIMVSVLYEPTREVKDFEIPSRMYAADFGQKVAEVFEGSAQADPIRFWFQVEAVSLRKYLRSDETLEQSGIWDGEILLVSKQQKLAASGQAGQPAPYAAPQSPLAQVGYGPSGGPVEEWKNLDLSAREKGMKKPGMGRTFIWKKTD
jgi:hypothetical protein